MIVYQSVRRNMAKSTKIWISVFVVFLAIVIFDACLKQLNYPSDIRLYGGTAGAVLDFLVMCQILKLIWKKKEEKTIETSQPTTDSTDSTTTKPNDDGMLRNS